MANGAVTTFTLPAAQLQGSSLSITGPHSVSVVTVRLADGRRTPVLKITADDIVIDNFVLDVRRSTTSSTVVTTAGRKELRGHVVVYLNSATAARPPVTCTNVRYEGRAGALKSAGPVIWRNLATDAADSTPRILHIARGAVRTPRRLGPAPREAIG